MQVRENQVRALCNSICSDIDGPKSLPVSGIGTISQKKHDKEREIPENNKIDDDTKPLASQPNTLQTRSLCSIMAAREPTRENKSASSQQSKDEELALTSQSATRESSSLYSSTTKTEPTRDIKRVSVQQRKEEEEFRERPPATRSPIQTHPQSSNSTNGGQSPRIRTTTSSFLQEVKKIGLSVRPGPTLLPKTSYDPPSNTHRDNMPARKSTSRPEPEPMLALQVQVEQINEEKRLKNEACRHL